MPRGGARENAGRKAKTNLTRGNPAPVERARVEAGEINASQAQTLIDPHIPELIDLGLQLARGVLVLEPTTHTVYKAPPNIQAIKYLMDRACGKPTEVIRELKIEDAEAFFDAYTAELERLLDAFCDSDSADQVKQGLNQWLAETDGTPGDSRNSRRSA